jgi:VanZ family protein
MSGVLIGRWYADVDAARPREAEPMGRPRPGRPSTIELVRWWAPVILWIGCILVASGDSFSSAHTGSWLSVLLGLVSAVPPDHFGAVHLIVRKTAHLVEYGLLGLLAYRAFQCTWRDVPAGGWWMASLALCLACGASDELHQSTVRSRTGSSADVLLDLMGAWLGIYLFRLLTARVKGSEVADPEPASLDSRLDA